MERNFEKFEGQECMAQECAMMFDFLYDDDPMNDYAGISQLDVYLGFSEEGLHVAHKELNEAVIAKTGKSWKQIEAEQFAERERIEEVEHVMTSKELRTWCNSDDPVEVAQVFKTASERLQIA